MFQPYFLHCNYPLCEFQIESLFYEDHIRYKDQKMLKFSCFYYFKDLIKKKLFL